MLEEFSNQVKVIFHHCQHQYLNCNHKDTLNKTYGKLVRILHCITYFTVLNKKRKRGESHSQSHFNSF